jgi:hypothetical protein
MTQPLRTTAEPVSDRDSNRNVGVDVDLHTALALARASTTALLQLSPLAHREINDALGLEIAELERRGDPLSLAAANAVRQYLPEAA